MGYIPNNHGINQVHERIEASEARLKKLEADSKNIHRSIALLCVTMIIIGAYLGMKINSNISDVYEAMGSLTDIVSALSMKVVG